MLATSLTFQRSSSLYHIYIHIHPSRTIPQGLTLIMICEIKINPELVKIHTDEQNQSDLRFIDMLVEIERAEVGELIKSQKKDEGKKRTEWVDPCIRRIRDWMQPDGGLLSPNKTNALRFLLLGTIFLGTGQLNEGRGLGGKFDKQS